jgi:hypothetical protein
MTTPMWAAASALAVLAAIAAGLRWIERREDAIRQRQWWRSWQREQYGRGHSGQGEESNE